MAFKTEFGNFANFWSDSDTFLGFFDVGPFLMNSRRLVGPRRVGKVLGPANQFGLFLVRPERLTLSTAWINDCIVRVGGLSFIVYR